MINRYQTLWLGGGPKVSIPVSQYDTMWRFVFSIINGSVEWEIPSGATAIFNGRKPDGNVIAISGTIADNKVTVDATEQMTVVAGEVVCELSIMSGGAVVGTANFTLAVEDAPKKDGEAISESDLSAYAEMIEAAGELVEAAQEIIEQGPFLPPGGTPGQVLTKTATGETWDDVSGLPDGGSNGQVLTKTSDGAEWSDAGTPTQAQTDSAVADWLDAHPEATTTVQDGSITEAKLNALLAAKIDNAFSTGAKNALLALLEKVAYIDTTGQALLDALEDELFPPANLVSIDAVFTQGANVIYNDDTLDDLKPYLVVTATYDDQSTKTVTTYTLSGDLTVGTSTITVSYGGMTDTFTVTVTYHDTRTVLFNWDFTQSLTDSVGSRTITLQNSNGGESLPTQDSTGLHFTAGEQIAYIPYSGGAYADGRTFEFDISSAVFAGTASNHKRLMNIGNANLLIYRNAGQLQIYNGSWMTFTAESGQTIPTTLDQLSGKTVGVKLGTDKTLYLYIDGVLIAKKSGWTAASYSASYLTFGGNTTGTASAGNDIHNLTITGFRIYAAE